MTLDWKGVAIIGGIAFAIYLISRRDVQKIAAAAGQAVNVTSPENLAYKAASAATPQGSVGSWLYDLTHSGSKEP